MAEARFDFSNQRVVVTGASRGIGFGVAKGFACSGAEVHILATGESVHDAAARLSVDSRGGAVTGHLCDITDRARVAVVFGAFDRIDVLVNNAGLELPTPLLEDGEEHEAAFRRIIDINVVGTHAVTREALRKMQRGGRIIVTSSIWGRTAVPEFSGYCSSKHANIGFMRSLARELGPKGINVNAVCPGWVKTDAAMRSLARMAQKEARAESDLLEDVIAAQALDGLMEPDDMIGPYLFLASDAAVNITGQALNVDRGEVMS